MTKLTGGTSDVARVLRKDRTTISRWLRSGLRLQREAAAFLERRGRLDHAFSTPRQRRNAEAGTLAMARDRTT